MPAANSPARRARPAALLATTLVLQPCLARSDAQALIESVAEVPVTVQRADQAPLRQAMVVSIVRQDAATRRPFIVLLHGRPTDAAGRAALGMQTYPANARYFASRGFVVLIPTRIGYGITRGPDLEYTGECASKRFDDGIIPAVVETRQLLAFAAQLPYVDPDRGIVVGESFGGLVAVAISAQGLRGVVGVVNVAGGDGGDSLRHVDEPCRPDLLQQTYERYGAGSKVPALWMYSANDRVWGPRWPGQWFNAFRAAGGHGAYVSLPADKNNGHYIFNRNALAWHPAFERFTDQLGFARPSQ